MVGGRTTEVDLALSQDDARNLASGGRASSGPGGKDNRNLYLVPVALPLCLDSPYLLLVSRPACKPYTLNMHGLPPQCNLELACML